MTIFHFTSLLIFSVILSQSDLLLHSFIVLLRFGSQLEKLEFQMLFQEEKLFSKSVLACSTERLGYATTTITIPMTKFSNLIGY